jgi:lipid-A-disaccharide synthase
MPLANPKIMLVAGEASGDQRGAEVAATLRQAMPHATLLGIGGKAMRAAGVQTQFDVNELAVMGFIEPLIHLPRILKIYRALKKSLQTERPDLLICIDYPGFNLRLAKYAKSIGIKVLFYISPQVWAWRQGRVKKIAAAVDHMAVIFPFEADFYTEHNVPVTYVGHPLTEKVAQQIPMPLAREQLQLNSEQTVVTLLPGSRKSEVANLLPVMLASAAKILQTLPSCQFVLALASTINQTDIQPLIDAQAVPVHINQDSFVSLCAADAVITASGTATLETALLQKPMVVAYQVNPLTAFIAKRVIKLPYISLCNIVAGEKVVCELLQDAANPDNIATETLRILTDDAYRKTILAGLGKVVQRLGTPNTAQNMLELVQRMLEQE